MNEKLMSGYLAFTTNEEYGAAAAGDAPGTAGTLISPWTMMFGC
jgi:hypothetical protein